MPEIAEQSLDHLYESLHQSYLEDRERSETHVSDLLVCIRASVLQRYFTPEFDLDTLFRFEFGRSFESMVFHKMFSHNPNSFNVKQELEVIKDELIGHIDIGADPLDYECKLTFSHKPDNPDSLFDKKFWWFAQMKAYCYMRERTDMGLVVGYFNNPGSRFILTEYKVEFTEEELTRNWRRLLREAATFNKSINNITEFTKYNDIDDLTLLKPIIPSMTIHKWACRGCSVFDICQDIGEI